MNEYFVQWESFLSTQLLFIQFACPVYQSASIAALSTCDHDWTYVCEMRSAFRRCLLEINGNGRFKWECIQSCSSTSKNSNSTVARAVEKYKNPQIIRLIKENCRNTNNTFHFENVSAKEIEKELKNLLSWKKAAKDSDIPTKVIKDTFDIFTPILQEEFNESLELGKFPSSMKLANITSVFEKDDRTDKSNYRPIIILPKLSKIVEKCI